MKTDNNAAPWWFRTDCTCEGKRDDGFPTSAETLERLPTREEFAAALDGKDPSEYDSFEEGSE